MHIQFCFPKPCVMVNVFSPSPWETKASGSLSSRPTWSTELLPEQSRVRKWDLVSKTKQQKTKQQKKSVPEIMASKTFFRKSLSQLIWMLVFSFAFAAFDAGLYCIFIVCGGNGICSSPWILPTPQWLVVQSHYVNCLVGFGWV